MTSPPKKQNPKPKFLLLQTIRLAAPFEGLNRSLAQLAGKLCSCQEKLETKVHSNCAGSEGVKILWTFCPYSEETPIFVCH